jgi:hypothetical protein
MVGGYVDALEVGAQLLTKVPQNGAWVKVGVPALGYVVCGYYEE